MFVNDNKMETISEMVEKMRRGKLLCEQALKLKIQSKNPCFKEMAHIKKIIKRLDLFEEEFAEK